MNNVISNLPKKISPTDPDSLTPKVLERYGLKPLLDFCASQGAKDYLKWSGDKLSITIPFPELETPIAKAQAEVAKHYHFDAHISTMELSSGKEVPSLTIGKRIKMPGGDHSPYALSNALEEELTFTDVVRDAYNALYSTNHERLPALCILSDINCVEHSMPQDFSEITDSNHAHIYTSAKRASLAVPLEKVSLECREELKDIFEGFAMAHGGRSGQMETDSGRNDIFKILQVPKESYLALRNFAVNLGLNPVAKGPEATSEKTD